MMVVLFVCKFNEVLSKDPHFNNSNGLVIEKLSFLTLFNNVNETFFASFVMAFISSLLSYKIDNFSKKTNKEKLNYGLRNRTLNKKIRLLHSSTLSIQRTHISPANSRKYKSRLRFFRTVINSRNIFSIFYLGFVDMPNLPQNEKRANMTRVYKINVMFKTV